MNRYELQVRGETVHLTFKRTNDSRRLHGYTDKKPNLFGILAAMCCTAETPLSLSPGWWTSSPYCNGRSCSLRGVAFCTRRDAWSSQQGRHRALAEALETVAPDVREEIVAAFTAEEARRAAPPKGPDRLPRTAAPKPPRLSQRQLLARICSLLERQIGEPA